jgi:hypothetical protein
MFKRAVRATVRSGALDAALLAEATDDTLAALLQQHDPTGLAAALRERRLFKRALDLPASEVSHSLPAWLAEDPDRVEAAEHQLAVELTLEPGEVLIDYPARSSMLGVDLALLTRNGRVERLTDAGRAGQLGLPRISGELYASARRLRIFTSKPRTIGEVPQMLGSI